MGFGPLLYHFSGGRDEHPSALLETQFRVQAFSALPTIRLQLSALKILLLLVDKTSHDL